jgi:hypothetical protein
MTLCVAWRGSVLFSASRLYDITSSSSRVSASHGALGMRLTTHAPEDPAKTAVAQQHEPARVMHE